MKVLVTGAAGYIGSRLIGSLLDDESFDYEVVGVDSLLYKSAGALLGHVASSRFEFHQLDVRDHDSLGGLAARCDAVVHLAAMVGAPLCEKQPEVAIAVNQIAAAELAKRARHARFINLCTNSGYGQTDGASECTEESPMTPVSVYGHTKADAERLILQDHPNAVSLRLATVFGVSPRMRFDLLVNDFASQLEFVRAGWRLKVFEPHFHRNFVGIGDVCRAIKFMLRRSSLTGAFNLGLPSANLTKMELAHQVCDVLGVSKRVVEVGEGEDIDKRNYIVSSAKIQNEGFHFSHQLTDGIREAAAAARLVGWEGVKSMRNA